MSYDIRSESEIKELFESLQWTIKYGKTKNFAKTRVLAAIKDKSLKPLRLSISQKRDLLADYGTLANDDEPNE